MNEVDPTQLKQAVEGLHSCKATLDHAEEIHERFKGEAVWDGVVHIFHLSGHPSAKIAYAWSAPVEGSEKRKFYAVLHKPPVSSAVEAVRASIVKDSKI